MTYREWLKFIGTYAVGVAAIAALDVAFDAFRGRPYPGFPTIALALGPLPAVTGAFAGAQARGTSIGAALVIKVMAAVGILGCVLAVLVDALAHWQWGWRNAMFSVLIGAVVLPLANAHGRRTEEREKQRRAAESMSGPPSDAT